MDTIDEVRLVANTVKHAEGGSAKQLRELRPELFIDPNLAGMAAHFQTRGLNLLGRRLHAPLSGEGLFLTDKDLQEYASAAMRLFEDVIKFGELHRDDDYFPRKP